MNEMQVFENNEFGTVRVLEENGKTLFCGSDVAKALGYVRPNDAIAAHCRATVKRSTPISGKVQEINFIPEGDVYRLITHSKLPAAEKFESWVFDEVLPAIRKTGGYIAGEAQMTDEELLARALTMASEKLKQRDVRIAELAAANSELAVQNSELTVQNQIYKPKAAYFDDLVDRHLLTNFRETAKELKIKEKAFVSFLLGHKYVYRDKKGKLVP